MADLPRQAVLRAVMPVLAERCAGPAAPRGTRFVDDAPGRGVFGTGDGLSRSATAGTPRP